MSQSSKILQGIKAGVIVSVTVVLPALITMASLTLEGFEQYRGIAVGWLIIGVAAYVFLQKKKALEAG